MVINTCGFINNSKEESVNSILDQFQFLVKYIGVGECIKDLQVLISISL